MSLYVKNMNSTKLRENISKASIMRGSMIRVLCVPTEFRAADSHYARTYRLLREFDSDDVLVTAYAGNIEFQESSLPANVQIRSLKTSSRFAYRLRAFKILIEAVLDGNMDVYHHMNFGFREFNPFILSNQMKHVPILLGPTEAGHLVPLKERKRVLSRNLPDRTPGFVEEVANTMAEPVLNGVINPLREFLFAKTVQKADRIVAVHSDAKETYTRYTDPEKIDVIPYGVDMEKFPYAERTDTDEFVVVGNLIKRKGHRYLLEAMQRVTNEYPTAHLHVVGRGPLGEELEQMAEGLAVEDAITFHGFVEDDELLDILHTARAFVHPSLSEGFSHVRLEAMSAGCPVIGTAVAGAHDLTRDRADGIIVPIKSSHALADAMLKLLADDELARQMGKNARKKVERDHDYADIGQQYLEIYRELADISRI